MTTAGADQRQLTFEVQRSKWQQHRFITTPLPAASRPGFPKTHLRSGPNFRTQLR
jgi:hypothetical protein